VIKYVVFLDNQRLKESVNYKQMKDGFACPLYCNTLFASSRDEFNNALAHAKQNNLGYWPTDSTEAGVVVNTHADLDTIKPIWPKIWRRLDEYPGNQNSLNGFIDWLGDRNEWVDILSIMGERGIQDIVEVVNNNKVKLKKKPEKLRVVGEAGLRPSR
jgi:hypothetical protein